MLVAFGAATSAAPTAQAQSVAGPPTDPLLRVDVGMHTSIINDLSLDPTGQVLATASDDKTVRLWALPSGRLIDTLRVPIGQGDEGKLYTAMVTPSGNTLAAGATALSWDGASAAYLFRNREGRLAGRLNGVGDVVLDMAIRADSSAFAVALAGGTVRVYRGNGQPLGGYTDFQASAYEVEFGPDNSLFVTALDGSIRRYDAEFRPRARADVADGRPFKAAVSPDGTLIAIGFFDRARVEIRDTRTLSLVRTLEPGQADGSLQAVSWSTSGRTVFAAGSLGGTTAENVVQRWDAASGRLIGETVVADDTVTDLLTHPEGGVLFATAEPSWGWLTDDGAVRLERSSPVSQFRNIYEGRFAVSRDGTVVEFGTEVRGTEPLRFDLRRSTVTPPTQSDGTLVQAPGSTDGTRIDGWQNTGSVTVNGRPVALQRNELARSAAVDPATGDALIGADFSLVHLDAAGNERGRIDTPAPVWGLTVAPDAGLAVAAIGDGTLRWYQLRGAQPLREVMALFTHADGSQWVAWTPEGFFDHSQIGGKNLVGYHFNDGPGGQPRWVDFAQVYRAFYAPDLVLASAEDRRPLLEGRLAQIGNPRRLIGNNPDVRVTAVCPTEVERTTRGLARLGGGETQTAAADEPPRGMARVRTDAETQTTSDDEPPRGLARARTDAETQTTSDDEPPRGLARARTDAETQTAARDDRTRGMARLRDDAGAASAPSAMAAIPVTATTGADCLRPGEATGLTRGLGRTGPATVTASAAGVTPAALTASTPPVSVRQDRPVALAQTLEPGVMAVSLTIEAVDRGLGLGVIDVLVNGRNVGRSRGLGRTGPAPGSAPAAGPAGDTAAQTETAQSGTAQSGTAQSGTAQSGTAQSEAALSDTAEPTTRVETRTINLDPGRNEITVRAYGADGEAYGESRVIELTTVPAGDRGLDEVENRLFVLAVGVDKHVVPRFDLKYAVADASSFADVIRRRSPALYDAVEIIELYDEDVTRDSMAKAFRDIADADTPDDTVLIYLAGHGEFMESEGQYFFVTHDPPEYDYIPDYGVSEQDLIEWTSSLEATNGMIFLDTCYAGSFSLDISAKMNHELGRYILAGSTSRQQALDSYNNENGVFATAVLTGLDDGYAAGRRDTEVSNIQLGDFVQREVPRLASEKRHDQSAVFRAGQSVLPRFPLTQVDAVSQ